MKNLWQKEERVLLFEGLSVKKKAWRGADIYELQMLWAYTGVSVL